MESIQYLMRMSNEAVTMAHGGQKVHMRNKIMIFEKNLFTTAVSIPKSFHLTQFSPTFEIHQSTLIWYKTFLYLPPIWFFFNWDQFFISDQTYKGCIKTPGRVNS